ncbi:MAG: diadenylate cyclase [Planctomycetota bacterium]|nr:diadenylate cyclase [Planctomycetota bacterium]
MSRIIPSHWGHQTAFRGEVELLARRVFGELDAALDPRVFLVGLVADHEDGIYPLFVDTPGDKSATDIFHDASRRAKGLRKDLYAAAREAGEDPDAADIKRRIVLEAWRQAVELSLGERQEDREIISFCSSPRPVREFLVCTVLRLKRSAWERQYALRKDAEDERARRPASLLDACVEQFMRRCVVGMAERHSGMSASLVDADPEEIIRAAGRLVTDAPALAGQRDLKQQGLWHACNTISSLRYEGAPCRGQLIISAPDHPGVVKRIAFHRPVRIGDHVAVRKLLATHQPGYSLLSDGNEVYGLGQFNLHSSVPDQNLFNITFRGHYAWELAYGLRGLIRVSYGHPGLPEAAIREQRFRALCRKTFEGARGFDADALWALTETATRQGHGTLVVIHAEVEGEVERLKQQAAPILPVNLDAEGILAVTAVDGAIVADPSGAVHAFSVILDGKATSKGNPARGARFNSAVRYVDSAKVPCIAVVVSEDGTVDVVANTGSEGTASV